MKYVLLSLCLFQPFKAATNHISYTQRMSSDNSEYHFQHTNEEYTNSILASIFLGAASGLLCREFEKRILQDFLLLRLINICIWGTIQTTIMNGITTDLNNQNIKHSPEIMKRAAWLASWASYILAY